MQARTSKFGKLRRTASHARLPKELAKPDYKQLGNSRDKVRMFSAEARRDAGYQLDLVQNGKDPDDWKPLPVVGLGVREIRVHAENEYRRKHK